MLLTMSLILIFFYFIWFWFNFSTCCKTSRMNVWVLTLQRRKKNLQAVKMSSTFATFYILLRFIFFFIYWVIFHNFPVELFTFLFCVFHLSFANSCNLHQFKLMKFLHLQISLEERTGDRDQNKNSLLLQKLLSE